MKRILFVDDEAHILDGLQNLLRKNRKQWDMVFALGGEAALAELAAGHFDVVVSDLRMPRMDGAELLERVKAEYPHIARIILSGQADAHLSMRAVHVAHQFLNKPCEANKLQTVIERVCTLQAILSDVTLQKVVGALDHVPSVPRTYIELRDAASRPDWSMADITAIMEQDPAMVAKMLQLVNSAYFGVGQTVASIQQAVSYLGVELLKGLALNMHVFSQANMQAVGAKFLEHLQAHAFQTARLARRLGGTPKQAEEAFTVGIVHDIGQIVLMVGMGPRYEQMQLLAQNTHRPLETIELDSIGTSHAQVGAYLLGMWGLPFPIVEATAFHHEFNAATEGSFELLSIVHVADVFSGRSKDKLSDAPVNVSFLERTGLLARLPKWRALTEQA